MGNEGIDGDKNGKSTLTHVDGLSISYWLNPNGKRYNKGTFQCKKALLSIEFRWKLVFAQKEIVGDYYIKLPVLESLE